MGSDQIPKASAEARLVEFLRENLSYAEKLEEAYLHVKAGERIEDVIKIFPECAEDLRRKTQSLAS